VHPFFLCNRILSHILSDYSWSVWLGTGFIAHFNIWLMTILNYSTIVELHTLQITTAHAISVCCVFTSHSWQRLLTVGILQLHWPSLLIRLPYNWIISKPVFIITFQFRLRKKHRSLLYLNHFNTNVFVCEGALPSKGCVYLLITNLLPSSGCLFQDRYPLSGLHTTLLPP
jgi:hypothetical protein